MNLETPPVGDTFAVAQKAEEQRKVPNLLAAFNWLRWFTDLWDALTNFIERTGSVVLALQSASIGTTPIPMGSVPGGVYRVSYRFRVTRPGSVSSSLQFTLSWTDGGVARSFVGVAAAGNLTSTEQEASKRIRVDTSTAIAYATTYASVGATAMQYALDIIVEPLLLDTV